MHSLLVMKMAVTHRLFVVRLLKQLIPNDIVTFKNSFSNVRAQLQSVLLCNAELMCSTKDMRTKWSWKTTTVTGICQFPHMSSLNKKSYRSFATTVSQLKMYEFSGQTFLKVLKCYNFLWVQRRHSRSPAASSANCVMTLYLLKGASANVSFYTNNSKMPDFELWHSCRKWAIWCLITVVKHAIIHSPM
jgi:hypothetical protein